MGCGKPKSGSKPELKLEKVNSQEIPPQSILKFTFNFVSASKPDTIFIDFAKNVLPDCQLTNIPLFFKIPDFPSGTEKGKVEIQFSNGPVQGYTDLGSPQCGDNDTLVFKFVIKDIKGNISDTVTSPKIVMHKE